MQIIQYDIHCKIRLFFLVKLLICSYLSLFSQCDHPDYDALIALYNSTNGVNWTNNDGWKEGADGTSCDPCNFNGGTWYGIICKNRRVICIDLDGIEGCTALKSSGNNLNGTIPEAIGNLTDLTHLYIPSNNLEGSIPNSIGDLNNLTYINLFDNQLVGNIPAEIGKLSILDTLELAKNNLEGLIPESIYNLKTLKYLSISSNNLSGQISSLISNLSEVHWLNISNNNLDGELPAEIGILQNLEVLQFSTNNLSGEIPSSFRNLNNLNLLSGSWNSLTGILPDLTGSISKLQIVNLSHNNFSGCFEFFYHNLCSLGELRIDGAEIIGYDFSNNPQLPWQGDFSQFCQTDGSIEAQVGVPCDDGDANTVNDVMQDDCSCQGQIIQNDCIENDRVALVAFYNATNGNEWTRNDNWLSDRSLEEWHGVTTNNEGCVIGLELPSNGLIGQIPSEIENLSELITLNLSFNQLNQNISEEIGNLSKLEILNLSNNSFIGNIPKKLGQLTNLEQFNLSNNLLSENIPSSLSTLSNLVQLRLNNNNLSGNIPSDLGSLVNLVDLYLDGNQLSGKIPPSLSNLSQLEKLRLSVNNLEEAVPSELGILSNLEILYLQNNNLSGVIPSTLGNLNAIKEIVLSSNSLTGTIPGELAQLSKTLKKLQLQSNQLSGCIPLELKVFCNIELNLDFSDNLGLSWQGDFSQFCKTDGSQRPQIDLLCDDGNPNTENDVIQNDCSCQGSNPIQGCINIDHPDYDALIALYESTNGENWTNNKGWKEGAVGESCDPCNWNGDTWYGIVCFNDRVTNIELWNNNLEGSLPEIVLEELTTINLHSNKLAGTVPPLLGLPNLKQFVAWQNQFTGKVPSFQNSNNLFSLVLDRNNFTSLPSSFNAKLEALFLFDNSIQGELPNLSNLNFDNPNLKIWLYNNNFSGCIPGYYNNFCNWVDNIILDNNSLLPWQGDFSRFCNGEPQISKETNIEKSICEGEVYQFGDTILMNSGQYTQRFALEDNCDSLVHLNLTFTSSHLINLDTILCPEEIPPETLTLNTTSGCDSIITYNVIYETNNTANAGENLSICVPDVVMNAILPEQNTGKWTTKSNAFIADPTNPKTTVSELEEGNNWFTWNLSTEKCTDYTKDSINIIFEPIDIEANDDIYKYRESPITGNVLRNDETKSTNIIVELVENTEYGRLDLDANGSFFYERQKDIDEEIEFDDFQYSLKDLSCEGTMNTARATIRFIDSESEPKFFTPNGDGVNDLFIIPELENNPEKFPENELIIFNRWGQVVFHASPYNNDWNGGYKNDMSRPVPEGSYFYIMKFTFEKREKQEIAVLRKN